MRSEREPSARMRPLRSLDGQLSSLPPRHRARILRLVEASPSPALAAASLARLLEASGISALERIPESAWRPLLRLLGSSGYLGDVLAREGERWPELFLAQARADGKSAGEHAGELAARVQGLSFAEFARELRRHKQREMLRIALRDLDPSAAVEETMAELSALAEGSLEACYGYCRAALERDYGELRIPGAGKNRFVILGMGKLGGEELNLSSDIDLVYLYESDEGESEGGAKGKASPRAFFSRLAETITRAMGEVTEEGFVFRTDLRLRPLGRHGPIVQAVDSALLYYESWGQVWERSALIKARPVAGDRELGELFLRQVEPFVFRRYLDFTTVEELREMKTRIETELVSPADRERNVKLGTGGIREVEFFIQALQLVNGGHEPRLRERNSLKALALLARYGKIPRQEARALAAAYRFLRDVEHKIQIVQEAQAHTIPRGRDEERALARRLGYRSRKRGEAELFWRDYRRHTRAVRAAFDRLFYGARSEAAGGEGEEIWRDLDREERVIEELRRVGFADPQRAYDLLLALRDGQPYSPPSPRRMKVVRALGPALVREIVGSGAPDEALFHLAEFVQRIGARTGFLALLAENPKTMALLVRLFASSRFLADLFVARPELLDSLIRVDLTRLRKSRAQMVQELRTSLAAAADFEESLNRLRRYRAEEFIRIGLHDLGGELELEEVTRQLSALAEACLEAAYEVARREVERAYGRLPDGRFAILAMGKLGGGELDYNSDLDLIFVYDAAEEAKTERGMGAHEYYVRLAQKLITCLSAPTEEGVAYRLDLRLRPSGRAGPLVTSIAGFRAYHETSSALWERQALIKLRHVAGDRSLGAAAEKIAERFSYGRGLDRAGILEIDRLRMRMERELAREDAAQFNLKKGRGGMVDVEFIAQMLQLMHGGRRGKVRARSTLAALDALREEDILTRVQHRLLADGYRFLRRLDHRLRLERGQSLDILEREPERLASVARALGFRGQGASRSGEALLAQYEKWRERIRACYESFFKAEGAAAPERADTG